MRNSGNDTAQSSFSRLKATGVVAVVGAIMLLAGLSVGGSVGNFGLLSSADANAPQLTSGQQDDDVAATQEPAAQPDELQIPEIMDEPKTVDPATLVPSALAKSVSVDFSDSSLREVADWLQSEQAITVLFDTNALAAAGIPQGEPVSDHLDNEPLYLLLNRLRSKGLAWFVEDDILNITTQEVADERVSTQSYSVGDLFGQGYEVDTLDNTITNMTSGGWLNEGTGAGTLEWLGDILFVRQGDQQQREVAGILQALRDHARRTFTYDPPQHTAIRERLESNVSVDFDGTPLVSAVAELAAVSGVDIRLDENELRLTGIRDREPVTLQLTDRKLTTVLRVLATKLDLDWMLQDGVLWVTSQDKAESNLKTALYDVRDLCQTEKESFALTEAIMSQTEDSWLDDGTGSGVIDFPVTGVMAIRNTEKLHNEILELLSMYRQALASSEPRERGPDPDQEIVTYYYRLPKNVAINMYSRLPQLVAPGTWSNNNSDSKRPGKIVTLESPPDLIGAGGNSIVSAGDEPNANAMVVPQQVLMITQTRENHEEIAKLIERVRKGEEPSLGGKGFGGGGMGGGGSFGGGYFQPRPKP